MIDSIQIKSPFISQSLSEKLSYEPGIRYKLCGEMYKEGEDGEGSWSHNGYLQCDNWKKPMRLDMFEKQRTLHTGLSNGGTYRTREHTCEPFLVLSGSVHKANMGHNIFGGYESIEEAVSWIVDSLEKHFDEKLPPYQEWEIERIDWAETWDLGSRENVSAFIYSMGGVNSAKKGGGVVYYEPKKMHWRNASGILWAADNSISTFKFYSKGNEFAKQQFKPFANTFGYDSAKLHQEIADRVLRAEILIRSRKIKEIAQGEKATVANITPSLLRELLFREIDKVTVDRQNDKPIAFTRAAVQERLSESGFTPAMQGTLFNLWRDLAELGEETVKGEYPGSKRRFFRHKKKLLQAGIGWSATKILEHEADFKDNIIAFVPRIDSPEYINSEIEKNFQRLIDEAIQSQKPALKVLG